jgi:hypothetical protein
MAVADTVSALDCVPICPETRALSDAQFFALLIDKLATEAGVDLADITQADLLEASEDGFCDLQGRVVFSTQSPETLKAIALYLVNQLA